MIKQDASCIYHLNLRAAHLIFTITCSKSAASWSSVSGTSSEFIILSTRWRLAAFSEAGKINIVEGIKVIGVQNLMNRLPITASSLYAKNIFNFVSNLFDKENNKININLEDEIIQKTLIK